VRRRARRSEDRQIGTPEWKSQAFASSSLPCLLAEKPRRVNQDKFVVLDFGIHVGRFYLIRMGLVKVNFFKFLTMIVEKKIQVSVIPNICNPKI
jgi:hypothetical protein